MKKILSILAVMALGPAVVFSQGCLQEGIIFTTQAQVDNFQINYPGCTQIEGNVSITGGSGSDITNLNGLSVVTSVGGDLIFGWNPDLNELTGLEALTYIGGNLTFGDSFVTSLTGLNALTTIAGNFLIAYHHGILTSLTGLEALTSVGGDFSIESADYLTNLAGLGSLTTIGGTLGLGPNNAMTTLSGLEALTSIGGSMIIVANQSLESLSGLDALNSIGGFLFIQYNDILMNLSDLHAVISIGGYLNILNNDALTSLSGLDNITASSIDSLFITENNALTVCAIQPVCEYLVAPGGTIEIHDNAHGCNSKEEVQSACDTLGVDEVSVKRSMLSIRCSPNPFHSVVTFEYELGEGEAVFLSIFNNIGVKVETLVNEVQSKGDHQVSWKAGNLPTGIYFYRIQAGNAVGNGKIIKWSSI